MATQQLDFPVSALKEYFIQNNPYLAGINAAYTQWPYDESNEGNKTPENPFDICSEKYTQWENGFQEASEDLLALQTL